MDILNAIFTFGPVAAAGYAFVLRPLLRKKGVTFQGGEATAAGPLALPQAQPDGTPPPLALAQWLTYVNDHPDTVPQLAVIGPSGSGKTTFARAVLGQRQGVIIVITAKEGDDWGGLPYIGIDDDGSYTTANQHFATLDTEVKRRLVAAKRKQLVGDWLTVVLDDYSTLRKECDAADEPFKLIARLGRSLRVRLLVLSDTALVKAWGLEGEGETRNNFAFVQLERWTHAATMEVVDRRFILDTARVQTLARVTLIGRAWQPQQNADAVLEGLLLPTNGTNERTDERTNGRNTAEMADAARTNERTAIRTKDDVIRLLVAEGWNVTQIRDVVKGEAAAIGTLVKEVRGEA